MVDEITMLKGQIEKLEAENASLKGELAFIKKGRTTTEAIDTRINNMNRSTVRIICLLINGLKMKDILEQLCISSSTYYRVISGKAIGDSQHMKDLYMQYEDRSFCRMEVEIFLLVPGRMICQNFYISFP